MMSTEASTPYWRLSGFYFFYFAVLGALVPYWSLYLQDAGFGGTEIGLLSALIMATRIVSPNLWGWLGDHTGQRLRIVRWGAALAALCFIGVLGSGHLWPHQLLTLALAVAAYSFFWNGILSQFEVITLCALGDQPQRYSRVRLWGSVGFIVVVTALGSLFDVITPAFLPLFLFVFLVLIFLCSLSLKESKPACRISHWRGFFRILKRRNVQVFLFAVFLLQLSFGPYYTFYSLFLERYGYSKAAIGGLWSLGVLAEIAIFMFMHRLLPYFGVRNLLLLSMALAALRWLMIGVWPEHGWVIFLAQWLHAFSFGTAHAASIEFVRRFFGNPEDGDHQGQGQSLYSSLSWGLGGALGALLAGCWWDVNSEQMFIGAALVSLLALVLVYVGIGKYDRRLR